MVSITKQRPGVNYFTFFWVGGMLNILNILMPKRSCYNDTGVNCTVMCNSEEFSQAVFYKQMAGCAERAVFLIGLSKVISHLGFCLRQARSELTLSSSHLLSGSHEAAGGTRHNTDLKCIPRRRVVFKKKQQQQNSCASSA